MTNKAPRTPPGKAKGKVRLIDANAIKFKKIWWRNPDGEEFGWEIADRGDIDNEPTVDILFVCDNKACARGCNNDTCQHTSDIEHAANFEQDHGLYWEKEVITKRNLVEVIRCKDCQYYEEPAAGIKGKRCARWAGDPYEQAATEPWDFCSCGERKKQ